MDTSSLPERIREKIVIPGECWIWTGCLVRGYAAGYRKPSRRVEVLS